MIFIILGFVMATGLLTWLSLLVAAILRFGGLDIYVTNYFYSRCRMVQYISVVAVRYRGTMKNQRTD
jgi:hypothetical protein